MPLKRIPAVFMRGGTSKALVFRAEDLPRDRAEWDALFLSAMGSPDPAGRQLDGMGGGLSSLSKVCVVGPPTRPDADVDYTFVQIAIREGRADYGGNCGNMSSAIGPFAIEEGIVAGVRDGDAVVRIHNTNTGKIIVARFPVRDGALDSDGDCVLDGVAGSAAPIRLEFLDPGGSKTGRLLPTGAPVDRLDVAGVGVIEASLIDAANPAVFVLASDLGLSGTELPDALEADAALLARVEAIRCAASVKMGLAADVAAAGRLASIPKLGMIFAPRDLPTLGGRMLAADAFDIGVRMVSLGQPHRAVPITGSICVAVAARVPGTLPHRVCAAGEGPLRIGHASGTTAVDARVVRQADGSWHGDHGAVFRTARRLFEGSVIVNC